MNKYETYIFKIEEESKLDSYKLIKSIDSFWNSVIKPSNKEVSLIYRVIYYKNKTRITLLKNMSFKPEELTLFKGLIVNLFEYNNDDILKNNIVDKIIIKYKFLDNTKDIKICNNFKLGTFRIPMTMDLKVWGSVFNFDDKTLIIRKRKTDTLYKVDQIKDFTNNIELKNNDNKTLLTFTDIRKEGDPINTFVRLFKHHIYYIYNGTRFFKLNKRLNKNN